MYRTLLRKALCLFFGGAMARSATEIQADLDAAYVSRRSTLQSQSYSLDSGQGKQAVTRADLSSINKTIKELEAELLECNESAAGFGVVSRIGFER